MRVFFVFLVLLLYGCGGGGGSDSESTVTDINFTQQNISKFIPFNPVGSGVEYNSSSAYSFIISDGDCNPVWDWDTGSSLETYKNVVTNGFISFGGAGAEGKSLAYVCSEDELFNAYKKVISTYGISWIDFDIEGGMLDESDANSKRFRVLKRLQTEYPNLKISLTLPVMPYGFDEDVKELIKSGVNEGINFYSFNLMLMDYGEDYPADDINETKMFDYSKEAIENVNSFLKTVYNKDSYNKIGAVAMIGVNDVSNEIWYKNDFALLKDYVQDKNLSMLSFWALYRDKPGSSVDESSGLIDEIYGNIPQVYTKIGQFADYPTKISVDQNDTFYLQLQGEINTSVPASVYDIDLFDTSEETINLLHSKGKKVICYFSAGSWEEWRSDADEFPQDVIGNELDGWQGEKWLDIRSDAVKNIMLQRLDLAVQKGCDGVDPDNVNGYEQNTGFNITYNDQLNYNLFLAEEAKKRGLLIALKNDFDQIWDLASFFDFSVSEQAIEYNEYEQLLPFILQKKPVFDVEYNSSYFDCTKTYGYHLDMFSLELNGSLIKSCDY